MATPATPQPSHDPVGLGLVGIASLLLGYSLRLIAQAFKAVRQRPEKSGESEKIPPFKQVAFEAVTEAAFTQFATRTGQVLGDLQRQFSDHESATDRIESKLEEVKGNLERHVNIAFQAQETRVQRLEVALNEFLRDQRIANYNVRQRLDEIDRGQRPSPGQPRTD